jgi:EB module
LDKDGQNVCVKKIFVGDHCENHNECAPYNGEASMECKNHTCVCSEHFELYDAYSKKCTRKESLKSSADSIMMAISNLIIISALMICAKVLI